MLARLRDHGFADHQVLHRDLAPGSQDAVAGTVARRLDDLVASGVDDGEPGGGGDREVGFEVIVDRAVAAHGRVGYALLGDLDGAVLVGDHDVHVGGEQVDTACAAVQNGAALCGIASRSA